jgi:cell division protein FtsL
MSEVIENKVEEEKPKKTKKSFLGKKFNEEKAYAILPFATFLTMLAMIYIANSYYVESSIRKISKLQTNIQELRAEDVELKTQLNMRTRQSEIILRAESQGLKPLIDQPTGVIQMKSNEPKQD